MNLFSNSLRSLKHGISHARPHINTKSISKRKVLFGSTILFGAVAPSLLSDSFSRYSLEPHSGNSNAKQSYHDKFKHILRRHQHDPILFGMITINLCVYGFWKSNPKFMQRHFLCNLENVKAKRYHVLLTSNWSHMDFWHVGLNMYVLYNFGSIMIKTIGIGPFAAIYIGAGVMGSFASLSWHIFSKMPHYSSLGASASLLGIIVSFAMHEPDARFKVVLSPDSLSFSAYHGVLGIITLDCLGLLFRWRFLDHAAHLAGTATGCLLWSIMKNVYGTTKEGENGLLCINGKYIFEGQYKDYKLNANEGKIYSPTKTYFGQMLNNEKFTFDGIGCLRNEVNGSVFYGYFRDGHIDGIGLLCFENGKVFPAVYDRVNKDFSIPNDFDPLQLKGLLNESISVVPVSEKNKNRQDSKDKNEDKHKGNDHDIPKGPFPTI